MVLLTLELFCSFIVYVACTSAEAVSHVKCGWEGIHKHECQDMGCCSNGSTCFKFDERSSSCKSHACCSSFPFCAYGLTRNALCHRDCLSEWVSEYKTVSVAHWLSRGFSRGRPGFDINLRSRPTILSILNSV